MDKDWSNAYEMRTRDFRNLIDKNQYMESMTKHSIGWDLTEYKIINASINDDKKVVMEIDFTYRIAPEIRPEDSTEKEFFTLRDISIWQKIDDDWLCHSAGIQGHLPLNDSITR